MHLLILILLFITLPAAAQKKLILDENKKDNYLVLELGEPGLLFIYDDDSRTEYIVRKEKENLVIIDSFESEARYWGYIDLYESYFSNDTIYIKAYKHMSALNGYFLYGWNGKTLFSYGYDFENPNDGMTEHADSLLAAGNIAACVNTLHSIQYPYSEFDTWGYGLNLMEKAHSLALEQYDIKNYDSAAAIMNSAFEYWENGTMLGFTGEQDFSETRKDAYNVWTDDELKLWIGDYGLFLYLAKNYEKSIEINSYLNLILPEIAGPYLQLGDSYFDSGKINEAKKTYEKYVALKKKQNSEKEIPTRVKERIK